MIEDLILCTGIGINIFLEHDTKLIHSKYLDSRGPYQKHLKFVNDFLHPYMKLYNIDTMTAYNNLEKINYSINNRSLNEEAELIRNKK